MSRARETLQRRALLMIGRDGLTFIQVARRLRVSRNVIAGIHYRSRKQSRRLTFGEALREQSVGL